MPMNMSLPETQGFLFIGDPHVSSKRIGRRKDDYTASVLGKLSCCARLCRDHGLTPVILGDLFHRNDDSNLVMLNRLAAVLREFPETPIVLEGNHDKEQSTLTDHDALTLLGQCGVVRVVTEPGIYESFLVQGEVVNLLMVPYGSPVPDAAPAGLSGTTVMVTHHDLAFGSAYPGALPLKEVKGVAMAVNGHMHDTKPSVQCGQTTWHNPGNIEPLSVDLADHVPCAWQWAPQQGCDTLIAHELPHGTDLFDMTGLQVEAADALESVQAVVKPSLFAQELQADATLDAERTDDAALLLEDLEYVVQASGVSEATALLMRSLAAEISRQAQAGN